MTSLLIYLMATIAAGKSLFLFSLFEPKTQPVNQQPIIGIFTQPSTYADYPETQYSYLAASYVKFVESSGARAVPIPYEADEETLDRYFKSINGILVPGGSSEISSPSGPTQFTKSVAHMLKRVIEANDQGDFFPLWATCLGHETLHYIQSGYREPFLIQVKGEAAVNHYLNVTKSDALIYEDLAEDLYEAMTTEEIVYYNHNWAVSVDLYKQVPQLSDFFDITALNTDIVGTEYVASAQAKNYPIITVQYHPEKSIFEWKVPANHSEAAVKVAQNHGDKFISLARQNHHQFSSNSLESNTLIYNYSPVQVLESSFVQIYAFKLGQLML